MNDMSVQGAAAAQQQNRAAEQPDAGTAGEKTEETRPIPPVQEPDEGKTIVEMIQDAQEKAKNQRETMKLAKGSTRYGDAPLEAYARLARAKTSSEVNMASGFARRRIAQFKTALYLDSENAARIKSAISQLQKAVSRGDKKKRELVREKLEERRKEKSEEAEKRRNLALRQRRTQRMIRESGYMREAQIADRLGAQLTATQMELRQQAQNIATESTVSLESAVQQYTETAAAPAAVWDCAISVQG